MTPIHVPDIDETATYECSLIPGDLVAQFNVIIERGWTTYQSDYDSQPEDICDYETIEVKVDGVYDYDGNEILLAPTDIKDIEKQLLAYIPSYN